MKLDKKSLLLYLVTDRSFLNEDNLENQVEEALKGGVTFVQLREKSLFDDELFDEAKSIQELCRKYSVPFIINDDVELAVKINADGVHVGQNDMSASKVRHIIGEKKILGVSVQTVSQAKIAQANGADYLGVGAVFHTNSKDDADDVSLDELSAICNAVDIPVVAIGGITKENALKLSESGICGIAVISAILGAENIKTASKELKDIVKKVVKND